MRRSTTAAKALSKLMSFSEAFANSMMSLYSLSHPAIEKPIGHNLQKRPMASPCASRFFQGRKSMHLNKVGACSPRMGLLLSELIPQHKHVLILPAEAEAATDPLVTLPADIVSDVQYMKTLEPTLQRLQPNGYGRTHEPEVRGSQELPLAPDDVGVTPTTPALKWLRTLCAHEFLEDRPRSICNAAATATAKFSKRHRNCKHPLLTHASKMTD